MLLINPPVTKPCEPPAGIAKISGFLKGHGIKHRLLDANLEGIYTILEETPARYDTWTKRAWKNISQNLAYIKGKYHNFDTYKRAVMDINRLIEIKGKTGNIQMSLSDYRDEKLSPVKSRDLLESAETFEKNLFYPYFNIRLRDIIEKEKPSIAGFSLNYLGQALCTFAMAGFLRKHYPHIKIVLGGGLITSWMRNPAWENPFGGLIDWLIDGPGEYKLIEMTGKIPLQDNYRPDYSLFPYRKYLASGNILPYSTSTGCYWNKCSFCPERAEKNHYKPLAHEKVMNDLTYLTGEINPVMIHLLDNATAPSLMKKLAEDPLSVPWYCFTRFTPDLGEENFTVSLKKSGCVMLKLGLESGSSHVLDKMQKGIDLTMVSTILKNLKKSGIATYIYLLFGTPQETFTEAKKTMEFVLCHSEYIDFLNIALFNMPVYGPDTNTVETKGFYEGDLSLYTDFIHPFGWNRKEVRNFIDKDFKKNPVIADIIKRNPPFFTSNHAAFFV